MDGSLSLCSLNSVELQVLGHCDVQGCTEISANISQVNAAAHLRCCAKGES